MKYEERIPEPLYIFDTSLASLRELWADSPETYAMVLHRISEYDDLKEALYQVQHLAAMSGDTLLSNARKRIHDIASRAIDKAERGQK